MKASKGNLWLCNLSGDDVAAEGVVIIIESTKRLSAAAEISAEPEMKKITVVKTHLVEFYRNR